MSYGELESALFSRIVSLASNATTESLSVVAAQTVEHITSSSLSKPGSQSIIAATGLISKILSFNPNLSPDSLEGRQTSNLLANSLSNIALSQSPDAPRLTRELLVGVSGGMVSGESAASITTPAFNASGQVIDSTTETRALNASGGQVQVVVPTLSLDARLIIVSWRSGLPFYTQNQTQTQDEKLVSMVHDVTLSNVETARVVVPLAVPQGETVRVEIPISDPSFSYSDLLNLYDLACVWWDDREGIKAWSSEGCYLDSIGTSSNNRAACVCTHLTEFAIMQRAKKSQQSYNPSPVLMWTYTVGAAVSASLFVFASGQAGRLVAVGQFKEWVAIAHCLMALQCLSRAMSDLMFSGQIQGYSLQNAPDGVVVIVASLPYTFSFWVASTLAFQWMAAAFNSKLRMDPFKPYKMFYYAANIAAVVVIWVLIGTVHTPFVTKAVACSKEL
eukprot:1346330-Amorphochlora_amoeboformis.AAC.1